jgi:hypothetical protein
MDKFSKLSLLVLCGIPLPDLNIDLDRLPSPGDVLSVVRSAFSAFLSEDCVVESIDRLEPVDAPGSDLHLIYVYGHAWLDHDSPRVLIGSGQPTEAVDGFELMTVALSRTSPERTVLILDCCHAAAFDSLIRSPLPVPRLVVYGSGAAESAIALRGDNASRLSLALHRGLEGPRRLVDLTGVVIEVAHQLSSDGVIAGQDVSYRMSGAAVMLTRGTSPAIRRRERTVSIVRNALLASGALIAAILGLAGWFYWTHVLLDMSVGNLGSIASSEITLTVFQEDPNSNRSDVVTSNVIQGDQIRVWIPARDVIVRVGAAYRDNAERGLSFPLVLKPGFRSSKTLNLALPSIEQIQQHPNMAYVPSTDWIHGRELERRTQVTPFWIDLRPPTVDQYIPRARSLMQAGVLKPENSFLLTSMQQSASIDAVGLGQLRSLNDNLGAVFGVIASGTSQQVSAPGDIVVGARKAPCPACPAPKTRFEAGLYCSSQKKRLPSDLEWELAVRGVDGRVYPWGNQFDNHRANVPGLPEKGDPSPSLKPVDAYPSGVSPYGLIDTVGNAGDWVTNSSGSYERVYMGATYRYNPEDATAFRMLPVTDDDYVVQEITARCVAEPPGS